MHYVPRYNLVVNYLLFLRSYTRESCNVRSTYINSNGSGNNKDDYDNGGVDDSDNNKTKTNRKRSRACDSRRTEHKIHFVRMGRKALNIYINKYAIARSREKPAIYWCVVCFVSALSANGVGLVIAPVAR